MATQRPVLDSRLVIPGFHGTLYDADDGHFLAAVPVFQVQVNVSNNDYQAAGSAWVAAVIQNANGTLTLTETVVQDGRFLKKLIDAVWNRTIPTFNFMGILEGMNGSNSRMIFRKCVPDGAIDVLNVDPGNIMSRAWSFRLNEPPQIIEQLNADI